MTPPQLPKELKRLKLEYTETKFTTERTRVVTQKKPTEVIEAKTGTTNPNTTVSHQVLIIG